MTDNRRFEGVWIPTQIWNDKNLNALEKCILMEIHYLDNQEHCFASNEYFAEFCGCSDTKVTQTIKKLKELGYIEQVSFDGRVRVLKSNLKFVINFN